MLKAYAVEDLKPGMIIGRDVSEDDVNILIQAGTVLTQPILDDLMTHAIFSVEVREGEETKGKRSQEATCLMMRTFPVTSVYMRCSQICSKR